MKDLARKFFQGSQNDSRPFFLYIGYFDPHRCGTTQKYGELIKYSWMRFPNMIMEIIITIIKNPGNLKCLVLITHSKLEHKRLRCPIAKCVCNALDWVSSCDWINSFKKIRQLLLSNFGSKHRRLSLISEAGFPHLHLLVLPNVQICSCDVEKIRTSPRWVAVNHSSITQAYLCSHALTCFFE